MGALFLLNGVVAILILILLVKGFLKHYKDDYTNKITNWFSVIFFSYLILLVLYFSWFFGFLDYNSGDYNLAFSIAIFVQTLVLFRIVYMLTKNKKIFYSLLLYFVVSLLYYLPFQSILTLILIVSFLLTLVLSFNFVSISSDCKRVWHYWIFYAGASLILEFLLFFNLGSLLLFTLISNSLFLIFAFLFLKDIERFPLKVSYTVTAEKSPIMIFIKYFVYIIVLTNFVLISTVGVHELGHVLVSRYYGCESRSILFEEGIYPYSEIVCDNLSGKLLITLAGIIGPIILAILLFIIGGKFIRPISLLVIGFNLIASYKDLLELKVGGSLIFVSSTIGLIFLFLGIAFLAKSRMREPKGYWF